MTEPTGARPPVASILIPPWNAADTLPLAVDSARRQTVVDIEIVIVGDGVTPASRGVIEPLVELDQRIRFLDLPKAPGVERITLAGELEHEIEEQRRHGIPLDQQVIASLQELAEEFGVEYDL